MYILLVEDDPFVRTVIKKQLEGDNHRVCEVPDVESAVKALRSEAFDLLITDIVLPRIDGGQLMKYVRAKKINIPIIAITGGIENAQNDYACYADLFADITMIKPIAKEDLLVTVRQYARRAKV